MNQPAKLGFSLDSEKFIVVVTGLSGAGKTVALRTLEDKGFFCVDNIPPPAVQEFLRILDKYTELKNVALGIDIRAQQFLEDAVDLIKKMKKFYKTEVLFLEAEDETILLRYKETRRPHPLSNFSKDLLEVIKQEKELLYPLRCLSDRIIETSNFNPHELKSLIRSIYGKEFTPFTTTIISFGYKKGIPTNADLVFDARFLPNPYFVPFLRELDGRDKSVKDFVLKQKETVDFLKYIKDFLNFLINCYKKEGRAYVTIAIGCTGGKHRSVVLVEEIADYLKAFSLNSIVIHRDL